jgi:hypothetical protein
MLEHLMSLNWALIFGVLFGVSEALDAIPQLKANSVWKLVMQVLGYLHEKVFPPKAS